MMKAGAASRWDGTVRGVIYWMVCVGKNVRASKGIKQNARPSA